MKPQAAPGTLVSTDELAQHLAEWRVFDCRHDLAKPELGEAQYRESHIPGALFAHLDRDLSGRKTGANGRHPLPERGAFLAWLGQQGLRPEDQVVCYDQSGGTMAARLWWMLRSVGHEAVAVLDGGFAKWQKEGRPLTKDVPRVAHAAYKVRRWNEAHVEADFVEKHLRELLLVDARSPARWRGEQEPIDPEAGHIPGAKNRFSSDNLAADGTFKPRDALKKDFLAVLGGRKPAEVVHYCGSGVAACHNLLAMEHAGLPGGKLYAGSWSEWIADPRRPREKT
ncbi:MAG TPA: sulfurtransferase [Burkholderiales bacterium]|nr:sulfurtransferase [Burkholderiales bacterium]